MLCILDDIYIYVVCYMFRYIYIYIQCACVRISLLEYVRFTPQGMAMSHPVPSGRTRSAKRSVADLKPDKGLGGRPLDARG